MKGRLETIVSSTNKIKGFKRKLGSWRSTVQKGDLSNFPPLLHLEKLNDLILNHFSRLQDSIDMYFPSISTKNIDCIDHLFILAEELDFTASERDKFIDLCADSTLKS